MIKIRTFFLPLVLFFQAQFSLADTPPNIVLLYSDDAGYGDFGFHGSQTFKTPHLDELAKNGVIFEQFYMSSSVCGPSRAALMTGRYQQRFGFEENNVPGWMSPAGADGEEMGLPLSEKTIGDHLKRLGYRTGIFGKWHLGEGDQFHPTKRGFDVFYGFRGGARSFYPYPDSSKESAGKGRLLEEGFGKFNEHKGYLTSSLAERVIQFIRDSENRPFFAYVSFNAVHKPMHADPEDKATSFKAINKLSPST